MYIYNSWECECIDSSVGMISMKIQLSMKILTGTYQYKLDRASTYEYIQVHTSTYQYIQVHIRIYLYIPVYPSMYIIYLYIPVYTSIYQYILVYTIMMNTCVYPGTRRYVCGQNEMKKIYNSGIRTGNLMHPARLYRPYILYFASTWY